MVGLRKKSVSFMHSVVKLLMTIAISTKWRNPKCYTFVFRIVLKPFKELSFKYKTDRPQVTHSFYFCCVVSSLSLSAIPLNSVKQCSVKVSHAICSTFLKLLLEISLLNHKIRCFGTRVGLKPCVISHNLSQYILMKRHLKLFCHQIFKLCVNW